MCCLQGNGTTQTSRCHSHAQQLYSVMSMDQCCECNEDRRDSSNSTYMFLSSEKMDNFQLFVGQCLITLYPFLPCKLLVFKCTPSLTLSKSIFCAECHGSRALDISTIVWLVAHNDAFMACFSCSLH